MSCSLRIHGSTHPGNVHPKNEDSHAIVRLPDGAWLLIVCDGMGGMGRGDQASQLAVVEIETGFREATGTIEDRMRDAIAHADLAVREALCTTGQGYAGSTVVMVHVHEGVAHVGWVGDSRVYLVRDGRVVERTRDHKLVQELVDSGQLTAEEARRSALSSVITRALGGRPPGAPAVQAATLDAPWTLAPGDRVVLCSDGLSDLMEDEELPGFLADLTPHAAADRLVGIAVSRGGHDNITTIVVACEPPGTADEAAGQASDSRGPGRPAPRRGNAPALNAPFVVGAIAGLGIVSWLVVQALRA